MRHDERAPTDNNYIRCVAENQTRMISYAHFLCELKSKRVNPKASVATASRSSNASLFLQCMCCCSVYCMQHVSGVCVCVVDWNDIKRYDIKRYDIMRVSQATTWVKRESEQQYKADFAAGRALRGRKKAGGIGGLPGGWGAAFGGGKSAKKAGGSGAAGWMPSWMKAAEPEPEPEPEPEVVEVSE